MKIKTIKIPVKIVSQSDGTKTLELDDDKKEVVSTEDVGELSANELLKRTIAISKENEEDKHFTLGVLKVGEESSILIKVLSKD